MVDEVVLKIAAETAWTIYCSRDPDVDSLDDRRFLLERHPAKEMGRATERFRRVRQLRDRRPGPTSPRRMLRAMKMLVVRVARVSTRPSWTLLAMYSLVSAAIVMVLRCAFGA
ncbi:hypothetical protein [Bradyrhizobium sp. 6(2017)]|uniref:hypothetical protein n=1 Tax=Bradyrhizobium sp. 6(2017) TaxID=1197460 RepID=UPI001FEE7B24|nr:hypothetical protein [Bradyrhizobium sp. 6(2017)]